MKYFGLIHHNQERTDEDLDRILQDCQNIIEERKASVECFAAYQDLEIKLMKEQPLEILSGATSEIEIKQDSSSHQEILTQEDSMERFQIEKEECIQKAVASANNEIGQLKSAVIALRDELEKKQIEKEESVQRSTAAANDEIVQLKETISALRDQMESKAIEYEERLQESKRSSWDEALQLKETISALREKLENKDGH